MLSNPGYFGISNIRVAGTLVSLACADAMSPTRFNRDFDCTITVPTFDDAAQRRPRADSAQNSVSQKLLQFISPRIGDTADEFDCRAIVLRCAQQLKSQPRRLVRQAVDRLFDGSEWQPTDRDLLSNPSLQPFNGWNADTCSRFALAMLHTPRATRATHSFFHVFTSLLRDQRSEAESKFGPYLAVLFPALQQLHERRDLAFAPCTVWCSMQVNLDDFAKGSTAQFGTFTMATHDEWVARDSLDSGATLFCIALRSGRGCWDLAVPELEAWFAKDQREVILSPDMRFTVTRWEKSDDVQVVHLQEAAWNTACWE